MAQTVPLQTFSAHAQLIADLTLGSLLRKMQALRSLWLEPWGMADRKVDQEREIVGLLSTKTDEEIVTLLGCDLADVIELRALRATEPFPPEVRRPAEQNGRSA